MCNVYNQHRMDVLPMDRDLITILKSIKTWIVENSLIFNYCRWIVECCKNFSFVVPVIGDEEWEEIKKWYRKRFREILTIQWYYKLNIQWYQILSISVFILLWLPYLFCQIRILTLDFIPLKSAAQFYRCWSCIIFENNRLFPPVLREDGSVVDISFMGLLPPPRPYYGPCGVPRSASDPVALHFALEYKACVEWSSILEVVMWAFLIVFLYWWFKIYSKEIKAKWTKKITIFLFIVTSLVHWYLKFVTHNIGEAGTTITHWYCKCINAIYADPVYKIEKVKHFKPPTTIIEDFNCYIEQLKLTLVIWYNKIVEAIDTEKASIPKSKLERIIEYDIYMEYKLYSLLALYYLLFVMFTWWIFTTEYWVQGPVYSLIFSVLTVIWCVAVAFVEYKSYATCYPIDWLSHIDPNWEINDYLFRAYACEYIHYVKPLGWCIVPMYVIHWLTNNPYNKYEAKLPEYLWRFWIGVLVIFIIYLIRKIHVSYYVIMWVFILLTPPFVIIHTSDVGRKYKTPPKYEKRVETEEEILRKEERKKRIRGSRGRIWRVGKRVVNKR